MKPNLTKNWIAKVLSLLLAITIWFLIKDHLANNEPNFSTMQRSAPPPRATIVPDDPDTPGTLNAKKR